LIVLLAAQALLIGLLLLERRSRIHAQRAMEDQAVYEQTVAALATDLGRQADKESPSALESALARLAAYAGASTVSLLRYADDQAGSPLRLVWESLDGVPGDSAPGLASAHANGDSRLEIPLLADGKRIGTLELHRSDGDAAWSRRLRTRLEGAAEVIAASLARARAARAIHRSEELNRAVLASISTRIAILDPQGTIIRVNEAWRELAASAGLDARGGAFEGENYLEECRRAELRGCPEAGEVRRGIEAVLQRKSWPFRYEYRCTSPEERWYELSVDCLEHAEGGAIIAHTEITSRRLAEIEADETRRQVAHLGRVALVGELAAAVSHEMRQPLAAIRANAEAGSLLLARTPPDVREARAIFNDIVMDDIRASHVIDHIRLLLRKDESTAAPIDVNNICRDAVDLLRRDATLRGVRLDLALTPRLPAITGDAVQIQQVVLNLTLNGLDAATATERAPIVVVGTAARHGEIEVFVRDSGRGLLPEARQHLFESFFTTKPHGLGLGLAIVRSIVERHRGRVVAENIMSGGAVFRVLLPAVVPESEATLARQA
jgi:C4-dicarboxylate-specific signal transduction histidine kinase